MKRLDVRFASGELSLEGVLHIPDGAGPFPAVIACHPFCRVQIASLSISAPCLRPVRPGETRG